MGSLQGHQLLKPSLLHQLFQIQIICIRLQALAAFQQILMLKHLPAVQDRRQMQIPEDHDFRHLLSHILVILRRQCMDIIQEEVFPLLILLKV